MNQTELDGAFRLLEAYWPGTWDEARCMVWADAFRDRDASVVGAAIREMGQRTKFPTVAEFNEVAAGIAPDHGPHFSLGSGYLEPVESGVVPPGERVRPDWAALRALVRGER